ncbi:MAG: hypothetical protein FWD49_04700 [Firmicutes bacterium]|nr:hypothetical protein [Bacillota bacterium]
MNGTEFIKMMYQDIETHEDKEILGQVVEAMKEVVAMNPFCEIDQEGKTPEGLYKAMAEHAKENATKGAFCFTPKMTLDFTSKYLGLSEASKKIIEIEDFI